VNTHEKLNYVELPARNFAAIKRFFETTFNWSLTDFGLAYQRIVSASGIIKEEMFNFLVAEGFILKTQGVMNLRCGQLHSSN